MIERMYLWALLAMETEENHVYSQKIFLLSWADEQKSLHCFKSSEELHKDNVAICHFNHSK